MVEIIPKEEIKSTNKAGLFFYFAVFTFIFSIIGYFVLNNFLTKADQELAALEADLRKVMTPEKISLEKELLFLEDKINKFSFLNESHFRPSDDFEVIEDLVHPKVWISKINLDSGKKEIKVSGETESFETLGQQIFILREDPAVGTVILEKVSITEQRNISFEMSFNLIQ